MSKYDIEKTLFVSDLDGTLLHSSGGVTAETAEAVSRLTAAGVKLTFATARSYFTAMQAVGGLKINLPVILHNGVFIRDMKTGKSLLSNLLPDVQYVKKAFDDEGLSPFVYAMFGDNQRYSYLPDRIPTESAAFQATRVNDPRDNPITDEAQLWIGDVFHVSCITNDPRAKAVYDRLKDRYSCIYSEDYYSRDMWLEIYSKKASKANAVLQLRDMLGCERVVVFGDGKNDIPMFRIADEAYAVEAAVDDLKACATAVIGSNDDGAVVKWIEEHI